MGWVYMRHADTGGEGKFPDGPGVVAFYEARGWQQFTMPAALDPDAPNLAAVEPEPEPVLSDEQVEALKGRALDEALDAAGLSKSGSADEKRARLAEHEAALAETTTTEGND